MNYLTHRPRLTDFEQICYLVIHLRNEGIDNAGMARRLVEIGAVDLDMLEEVMQAI